MVGNFAIADFCGGIEILLEILAELIERACQESIAGLHHVFREALTYVQEAV